MRKKNCNITRMRRLQDVALKGIAVAFVGTTGAEKCEIMSTKSVGFVRPTHILTDAITKSPHHWCILLAAFGIDANGKKYFKSVEVKTKARYYHSDLSPMLIVHHEELVANFNSNQLVQTGWIASPSIDTWDEKKAAELFELLDPWDVKDGL